MARHISSMCEKPPEMSPIPPLTDSPTELYRFCCQYSKHGMFKSNGALLFLPLNLQHANANRSWLGFETIIYQGGANWPDHIPTNSYYYSGSRAIDGLVFRTQEESHCNFTMKKIENKKRTNGEDGQSRHLKQPLRGGRLAEGTTIKV